MRAIFIAMLLALGIGLVGTAGSRAAPVDGAALLNAIEDLGHQHFPGENASRNDFADSRQDR